MTEIYSSKSFEIKKKKKITGLEEVELKDIFFPIYPKSPHAKIHMYNSH
jgi:hypothetical protein